VERIMRRMISFDCQGARLAATLDEGSQSTGLLIISGGNEIRCGAYAGQAAMAAHFAALGYPVLRYDRRGIGDSEGDNGGFEASGPDIASAVAAFRHAQPSITHLVAYGNCDAASALALFHHGAGIDALILANPWVIEAQATGTPNDVTQDNQAPTPPSASAIRARYWARLKNPRSVIDVFTGQINLRKLASGLARAVRQEQLSRLSGQIAHALALSKTPTTILIATRDTTAMAFTAAWKDARFDAARKRSDVTLSSCATASHSFADAAAKAWLFNQIGYTLRSY
jgi:exosortase A-associated hydrolase 1